MSKEWLRKNMDQAKCASWFSWANIGFFPVLGEIGGAKVGQRACNFHTNLGLRSWGSWMSISSRYGGIYYIMYIYIYLYLIEAGPTSFIIAPWWPCFFNSNPSGWWSQLTMYDILQMGGRTIRSIKNSIDNGYIPILIPMYFGYSTSQCLSYFHA